MGHPNTHLCSGSCKAGTCDSQKFCIDDGCGSVIKGDHQCTKQERHRKQHKTTHPTSEDDLSHIPSYSQDQQFTQDQGPDEYFPPQQESGPTDEEPYEYFHNINPPQTEKKGRHKGHNNIHPTTPDQNLPPEYSQTTPTTTPGSGQSYYLNKTWDTDPCKKAGSGEYDSCRRQGPIKNPRGDYRLDVDVTNFDHNFHDMEITSGGQGSSDGCCCGVTLGVHGPTGDGAGYVYAKTEDWGPLGGKKHGYAKYLCDDSGKNHVGPCNNPPQRANLSGKTVHLMWQVQNVNGGAKYTG
ncbi:MAG: hypothetical protein WAM14_22485, partial [Candidatus Nitrosopolaris sp.]